MLRRRGREIVGGGSLRPSAYEPPQSQAAVYRGLVWLLRRRRVFGLLLAVRLASAALNIVHDCDEVFNYWEPLHYLLYGYGLQTWEYSAKFALRPYLYLLLHTVVGAPVAAVVGAAGGKAAVFYAIRAALGAISAACDTALVRATAKCASPEAASILLVLLMGSTGPFLAATTLLPSTFSMYAVTYAAAAILEENWLGAILPSVVGVVWGWTVAAVAVLPYALAVLLRASFPRALSATLGWLLATLAPLVLVDRLFYGTWTISLWNFIQYNVIGGGESALYGVESATFYLRNGLLNFNIVFLLAMAFPVLLLLHWFTSGRLGIRTQAPSKAPLLLALCPAFVWTAAISALPHKEERFLYVVYPLICLCASLVLAAVPKAVLLLLRPLLVPPKTAVRLGVALTWGLLALALALSAMRTAAQLRFYGAPIKLFRSLPSEPFGASSHLTNICVGNEWHRFPSSFFLPSPNYRIRFIKSGFGGLLPKEFSGEAGGTAAAPVELNDKNQPDDRLYVDAAECDYFVGLAEHREGPAASWREAASAGWQALAELPFVETSQSPALFRALYVPYLSHQHNAWMTYVLLRRMP
eukprot:jgi/Tetstr1/425767/TSEL_001552.t1